MKSLMDLGTDECVFIEGEPDDDAPYCGEPVIESKSYCAAHMAVCYQAPMIPKSLATQIKRRADAETPKTPRGRTRHC